MDPLSGLDDRTTDNSEAQGGTKVRRKSTKADDFLEILGLKTAATEGMVSEMDEEQGEVATEPATTTGTTGAQRPEIQTGAEVEMETRAEARAETEDAASAGAAPLSQKELLARIPQPKKGKTIV